MEDSDPEDRSHYSNVANDVPLITLRQFTVVGLKRRQKFDKNSNSVAES